MKIINELIIIRKPEQEDADALHQLKNDLESNALLEDFTKGYSKEDIKEWIRFHNDASNECLYLIQEMISSNVIGHVGLYNIDHRVGKAEFAILIADKSSRGKGYGQMCTEFMLDFGFNQLHLNRIELSLLSTNTVAYNLYLKMGFIKEGLLKQAQFKDGNYIDVILMAKFKD